MPRKLKRWWALPAKERWLLVEAAILLPVTWAMLRSVGFVRTRRFFESPGVPMATREIDPESVEAATRIGWLVEVAARHCPFQVTCLPRSLALCWLLRQRGLPARLRIGVRRSAAGLLAHAWVDVGDHLIGEPPSTSVDYAAYEGLDPIHSV